MTAETQLTAISPIDGRYANKTCQLSPYFSEYALIRYRIRIEIEWFIHLSNNKSITELPTLSAQETKNLRKIWQDCTPQKALQIKQYEQTTNHDVKAVEYYLQNAFRALGIDDRISFIHFAATSEDINNLAYALMLCDARQEIIQPEVQNIINSLIKMAETYADLPMMSRTHGQPATPTTLGKEIINVIVRLKIALQKFTQVKILGKNNGAVGNYNAHLVAYPNIDWHQLSEEFIIKLGLAQNPSTTQIEPHDYIVEMTHTLHSINSIMIDFATDAWRYIAIEYFIQKSKSSEVGSSTMPHKINPIDFENAEGNLILANSLAECFARKLPISRWQRDLTDSTILRNLGVMYAHSLIAYQSLLQGIEKLVANEKVMAADLERNWSLLSEPLQTVMRRYGITDAYEQLKQVSRGKNLSKQDIGNFIDKINLPEETKANLRKLQPSNYIGNAAEFTKQMLQQIKNDN